MRLLLVEDSSRLRASVGAALRRSGYVVDACGDGEEGLWHAETHEYDVIVLDIMLPKLDGLALLQKLRRAGKATHVLLLTARDTVADRVRGLRAGADDYLVKPFSLDELLARVEALCRRAYGEKSNRIAVGDLEIDGQTREVFRAGEPIKLKPREFRLLEFLVHHRGQVVTRDEIESHIYDSESDRMSNVVESAVSSLRKKLSAANSAPLIHTRHGIGYVLKATPE